LALGQESGFGLKAGGLLAHPPDTQVEPFRVSEIRFLPERCLLTSARSSDNVRHL
jgi:hypothetical protein